MQRSQEQEQFIDNPPVPLVPAAARDVVDVGTVVRFRRNDVHAAFGAIAVESAREVDRPGAEHDGSVGQRRVPVAVGGSTQTGDDAPNGRVSSPSYRDKLRRDTERLRRRDQDAGISRSGGKYDGKGRETDQVKVDVGSSVSVEQQVASDVAALDDVWVSQVGRQ